MPSNFAVHSDLLVHWTGRDIDQEHQPNWENEGQNAICDKAVKAYLLRLKSILKHGLWLTEQEGWTVHCPEEVQVPKVPAVCFTELKLSQSRAHAKKYGRLGIAVKRPFVFNRDGRPMIYFGSRFGSDPLVKALASKNVDNRLLQFCKPMDSSDSGPLKYDFYSESEWRIIAELGGRCGDYIVDPWSTRDIEVQEYAASLPTPAKDKLKYLAPLDGWHAAVIYPGLKVKNAAQSRGSEVRSLLRSIAGIGHANCVEGDNLPMELDLDLCRNL